MVFKVFLVEDEIVVREGLRNNILWERYGFTYAGDASDGEMALPLIREIKPDLLITDIKMPFMDGLALSELVRKELPRTKIVIISGYDDFSYAQQAIRMGVEQYMLKPVTKDKMVQILDELHKKMEAEEQQEEYLRQFQREAQAYETFSRKRFFEQIVSGSLSVSEIYETAKEMDMDINAQAYNIVFLSLNSAGHNGSRPEGYTDTLAKLQDRVTQFFLNRPELLLFRWNLNTYAVMVKGDQSDIAERSEDCLRGISEICREAWDEINWYLAGGTPVTRISALPQCFTEANRIISYRHLCPEKHILSEDCIVDFRKRDDKRRDVGENVVDPELIRNFLSDGSEDEIDNFVEQLLNYVGEDTVASLLFSRYLAMTICFAAAEYLEGIGYDPEVFLTPELRSMSKSAEPDNIRGYVHELLKQAIELRDRESKRQKRDLLIQAIAYIDEHYFEESISLNKVAKEVNISPNYLSAVFSQEVGQTFVEYLTMKRIGEAKRLLRQTDKRSNEVAFSVGYKDPHYFSFVFKKTTGLSPREYRRGGTQ